MFRSPLVLAVLCAGIARGAGPSYSAAGIVNASNYSGGPFAPNSVVSIFGAGLARSTHALAASDIAGGTLPDEMNFVRVYVQNQPMPLLFVSETQINFLMSSVLKPGPVTVYVATEGTHGPEVVVTLVDSAPALFALDGGYAIATNVDNKLLTADNPAHAGDFVVVYATGLGYTDPPVAPGEIPRFIGKVVAPLKVTLAGKAVPPDLVKYIGLTPGSTGLYQINLVVPEGTGADPEIGVTTGSPAAQPGLKLPVR